MDSWHVTLGITVDPYGKRTPSPNPDIIFFFFLRWRSAAIEKNMGLNIELPTLGRFLREKVNFSILFLVGNWDLFYHRIKFDRLCNRLCGWAWESDNHLYTGYMRSLVCGVANNCLTNEPSEWHLFKSWDFLYATHGLGTLSFMPWWRIRKGGKEKHMSSAEHHFCDIITMPNNRLIVAERRKAGRMSIWGSSASPLLCLRLLYVVQSLSE